MALSMASLAEPGSEKTPREKWHYTKRVTTTDDNTSSKTLKTRDTSNEILADSANEKDVNTKKFKKCMDTIENEVDALLKAQEFSDVGNVSIMIDSKNIVETCIKDLKADIENDVKKLKAELDAAYNEVVAYHNVKQVDYNSAAENKARSDCNSGTPKHEEIPE